MPSPVNITTREQTIVRPPAAHLCRIYFLDLFVLTEDIVNITVNSSSAWGAQEGGLKPPETTAVLEKAATSH